MKRTSNRDRRQTAPGFGSTYEGLKLVSRDGDDVTDIGFGSTYEGLKLLDGSAHRCCRWCFGSTYEGLKLSYLVFALLSFLVLAVPMRA